MTTQARRLALATASRRCPRPRSRRRARPARRRGRAARRAAAPAPRLLRRRYRPRGGRLRANAAATCDQQRRLADAGIAAEQQHRAAHQAAAGDAVELGDAARPAAALRAPAPLSGSMTNSAALARTSGRPALAAAPSSTSVFQPPQASQRPGPAREAAPQLWQTKFVRARPFWPSIWSDSSTAIDEMAARPSRVQDLVADGARPAAATSST